jgi:hypothetical protein
MPGGCCLLGVCCPPGPQRKALADELGRVAREANVTDLRQVIPAVADAQAGWLLDNFDLVPRGVGVAIAEGYRPLFTEFKRAEGGAG